MGEPTALPKPKDVLLLVIVCGHFCPRARQLYRRLSLVGGVRAGAVGLLVLVETQLLTLQHHAHTVPRSEAIVYVILCIDKALANVPVGCLLGGALPFVLPGQHALQLLIAP